MKVYAQTDYIARKGSDYFGATYRDFVPDETELRKLLKRHIKIDSTKKLERFEHAILQKEHTLLKEIRKYIEQQIASGIGMTRAYKLRAGIPTLKIRKETWFPYWKAIKEKIDFKDEYEVVEKEYDPAALTEIHKWLTHELQNAFGGFNVDTNYRTNEAKEVTAAYKTRTFEFEIVRFATETTPEESYNWIIYNNNKIQSIRMWGSMPHKFGFDEYGFEREMKRIGVWK